jgi:hypothetical protein
VGHLGVRRALITAVTMALLGLPGTVVAPILAFAGVSVLLKPPQRPVDGTGTVTLPNSDKR